ncbi:MAG: hypothetical protein OIN88_04180 [Candidatus Methanoperedens sp.]|nr:hypothetical protein [Candidatus Methanoperedens sp.]MCZ7359531.1 hypothetical protein [Candidatus Methanoperedens sp.]HLB70087.1 hypothetical protein [Candidatus Methanoperedens sp.]
MTVQGLKGRMVLSNLSVMECSKKAHGAQFAAKTTQRSVVRVL